MFVFVVAVLLWMPLLSCFNGDEVECGLAVLTSVACTAATLVGVTLWAASLPRMAQRARVGAADVGWNGQLKLTGIIVMSVFMLCAAIGVPSPWVPSLVVVAVTASFLLHVSASII